MNKIWINKKAFENALGELASAGVHSNMPAILAMKYLGVNEKSYVTVRSKEDFREKFLSPFFEVNPQKGLTTAFYKLFDGEFTTRGTYSHGTLYTPLRGQRQTVGKKAFIWERDELALPSSDKSNYNVRFSDTYIQIVAENWLTDSRVPLEALAIYLQAMTGEVTCDDNLDELTIFWKERLHITPDELGAWFKTNKAFSDVFSEEVFEPNTAKTLMLEKYPIDPIQRTGTDFSYAADSEARNLIVSGPPGSGKSTEVAHLVGSTKHIRCVFHSETGRADFVGTVKPVTHYSADGQVTSSFDFIPGAFTQALAEALESPEEQVFLVIEELNRADAAAAFGELLQLLDRDSNGQSVLPVRMPVEIGKYLSRRVGYTKDVLYLPSNLWLIATMNTADESLRPLDSAFKRRWDWMDVDPLKHAAVYSDVQIEGHGLLWSSFVQILNEQILDCRPAEDCRIGIFYLRPKDNEIRIHDISMKLLPFLWQDIHRHAAKPLFQKDLVSLPEAQKALADGGLQAIFDWLSY